MRRSRLQIHRCACLALLAAVAPAYAGLVSVESVKLNEAISDTIVVGSLTAVARTDGPVTRFRIKAIRVLKGSVVPGAMLDVVTDESLAFSPGAPPNGAPPNIWFLKQSDPSTFVLLPARKGSVDLQHLALYVNPAKPEGFYAYRPMDSPLDMIVNELAAFAEKVECVEAEDEIVQALRGVETARMNSALRRLAASSKSGTRATGVAALIQRGDVQGLTQLEADLYAVFGTPAFRMSTGWMNIWLAVESAYRNTDTKGIAILARLAVSSNVPPELRRASAVALQAIETRHAPQR